MSQIIRGVAGYLTYQYIGKEENPSTSLGKLRRLHLLQTRLRWPDIDVNTTSTLKPKTSQVTTTGGSTGSTEVRWVAAVQLRKQHGVVELQDSDSLQWMEMVMVGVMIRCDDKKMVLFKPPPWSASIHQPTSLRCHPVTHTKRSWQVGLRHFACLRSSEDYEMADRPTIYQSHRIGTWHLGKVCFFWGSKDLEALWWTKTYTKNHSPSQLGW